MRAVCALSLTRMGSPRSRGGRSDRNGPSGRRYRHCPVSGGYSDGPKRYLPAFEGLGAELAAVWPVAGI